MHQNHMSEWHHTTSTFGSARELQISNDHMHIHGKMDNRTICICNLPSNGHRIPPLTSLWQIRKQREALRIERRLVNSTCVLRVQEKSFSFPPKCGTRKYYQFLKSNKQNKEIVITLVFLIFFHQEFSRHPFHCQYFSLPIEQLTYL